MSAQQAQFDFQSSEPDIAQRVLITRTVVRHRLATDARGRFLEFSVTNEGGRTTRCRWRVQGELGGALQHGRRYAVVGRFGAIKGSDVLLVRVFLPIGFLPAPCTPARRARHTHRALLREPNRKDWHRR